ncbi:MAG: enoyl-CoA hydratase/carnithine racemase [Caulobacteraceae bacterium]|nr:MAG: enoyl-CoA hydratase/carnithine racemase [Caulobacteraceae bacterium]
MTSTVYRELTLEVNEPVATITLNRPDRLNALTARLLSEIPHALAAAEADARVVGIVLTGAGRGFSAGADMDLLGAVASGKGLGSDDTLESEPGDVALGADFAVTYSRILRVRKPIVAAVNGPCAGIGMAIALLCDMRFASENALFITAFAHRGLIAEHGMSWMLPRLVGASRALDLLWSARRVDATEAYRIGLLDRVMAPDELLAGARRYIEDLAARSSPTSLMLMKQQVYKHLMTTLGPAMQESNRLMMESLGREDFKEGVASFLEKRPPRFKRLGT